MRKIVLRRHPLHEDAADHSPPTDQTNALHCDAFLSNGPIDNLLNRPLRHKGKL
jgi:hypothetical protein